MIKMKNFQFLISFYHSGNYFSQPKIYEAEAQDAIFALANIIKSLSADKQEKIMAGQVFGIRDGELDSFNYEMEKAMSIVLNLRGNSNV